MFLNNPALSRRLVLQSYRSWLRAVVEATVTQGNEVCSVYGLSLSVIKNIPDEFRLPNHP